MFSSILSVRVSHVKSSDTHILDILMSSYIPLRQGEDDPQTEGVDELICICLEYWSHYFFTWDTI